MPHLKYDGPLPRVEVSGFGHFVPGERKLVDRITASAFLDPKCQAEGWIVEPDAEQPIVEPSSDDGE